jgi:hypothetical protein
VFEQTEQHHLQPQHIAALLRPPAAHSHLLLAVGFFSVAPSCVVVKTCSCKR